MCLSVLVWDTTPMTIRNNNIFRITRNNEQLCADEYQFGPLHNNCRNPNTVIQIREIWSNTIIHSPCFNVRAFAKRINRMAFRIFHSSRTNKNIDVYWWTCYSDFYVPNWYLFGRLANKCVRFKYIPDESCVASHCRRICVRWAPVAGYSLLDMEKKYE